MADPNSEEIPEDVFGDNEIRTLIEFPEGCIPTAVVEVVEYLDEDNDRAYVFRVQGADATSTIVGLMELAKARVMADSVFPDDD